MKTLVTYYSRTGTTRAVGEAIARELGTDSEEIVDGKNHPRLADKVPIAGTKAERKK